MPTVTEQAQEVREYGRTHPDWFWHEVLGAHGYDKQYQMTDMVRDNPQVAIVGANGTGKDWNAGRLMLWWQTTHSPAKTVIIGPTHRQVHDVVWSEARAAFIDARFPLEGRMFQTSRWYVSPDHYAVGFATKDPFNIQGYHSPNLLVICTEAHNIPQAQFNSIMRLNPKCLLLTGNPLVTSGEFYEAFHAHTHNYATLRISALDTPNLRGDTPLPGLVMPEQVERNRLRYGEESPLYIAGTLGDFPDNLEDAVVPRSKLMEAVAREIPPGDDDKAMLSCDVARGGEDSTVVYRRQGHQNRLVWKAHGRDTQQIAGKLIVMAKEDKAVTIIIIDDVGVGGGVTDRLREERPPGVRIVAFNGGSKARKADKYVNAVTEAWYEIREAALEGYLDIDENPDLIGQLASRRFSYLGSGRVQLEKKEDYKQRVGGSPDDADAMAMAYSPLIHARPRIAFA